MLWEGGAAGWAEEWVGLGCGAGCYGGVGAAAVGHGGLGWWIRRTRLAEGTIDEVRVE
ncbi:hypothetical protein BDZ85DRAFT_269318 [Elsinoe ampelina]|uniref:Uncharacterized protein n=1 Tax=Elsinoe ampelina TaxID=302913 RepID=A0A6A6G014_9PEZI|nr:hypothetical protein BDZ85DRAFT_269318 [Elsinoe ampelina]